MFSGIIWINILLGFMNKKCVMVVLCMFISMLVLLSNWKRCFSFMVGLGFSSEILKLSFLVVVIMLFKFRNLCVLLCMMMFNLGFEILGMGELNFKVFLYL